MNKIIKLFLMAMIVLFSLETGYAQKPDRSKIPALPPPAKLVLPAIQQFELSNGLKVYLMEKHEVPLVQLNLIVKTGSVNDPENKTGLANITADMMDEGAAGKSSLELADAIDYLGAKINTNSDHHFSGIYLHTPLSKFDDALKLFANISLKPDFPQNELDRKKKEILTTIMQWFDQPNAIASISFSQLLFGKDNAYGKPTIGYEQSIKDFTSDDLKNYYQKYFKANNAFMIAVGDVKKDELKSKLENYFGKWEKGSATNNVLVKTEQVKTTSICLIDKPGSAQSVIYIGRIGVARDTKDYNPISIMNTILGGSFSSRLNQNLRETHGYTYGAGSRFMMRLFPGPFVASSQVQTEVTDKALQEFFNEFKKIAEPIPAEDLTRGKNYLALGYPDNFQTVSEISGQIEDMIRYNLPQNYFNEYVQNILDVPADEVNNAAKKYINTEQMLVVVVGDKTKIENGIKKLNLGEVKTYSIEDMLGKIPQLNN